MVPNRDKSQLLVLGTIDNVVVTECWGLVDTKGEDRLAFYSLEDRSLGWFLPLTVKVREVEENMWETTT